MAISSCMLLLLFFLNHKVSVNHHAQFRSLYSLQCLAQSRVILKTFSKSNAGLFSSSTFNINDFLTWGCWEQIHFCPWVTCLIELHLQNLDVTLSPQPYRVFSSVLFIRSPLCLSSVLWFPVVSERASSHCDFSSATDLSLNRYLQNLQHSHHTDWALGWPLTFIVSCSHTWKYKDNLSSLGKVRSKKTRGSPGILNIGLWGWTYGNLQET